MEALEHYESSLEEPRRRFADAASVRSLFRPDLEDASLELFLIQFSALGVPMTEPVEGWIRRAGERCSELGADALGRALRAHARQEAGHHRLMIADTRVLVAAWNERRVPRLDADRLLTQPMSAGVRRYRELHESVVGGDAPWGQLAIESEIEMLSVRFGPVLIEQCLRRLDPAVLEGLSFLREHVSLDVGHARFNRKQLERLLGTRPGALASLVEAGVAALEAYAAFLGDCSRGAEGLRAGAGERVGP